MPEFLPLEWVKRSEGSWLAETLGERFVRPRVSPLSATIERLATETNRAGPQPLWEGYGGHNRGGPTRTPDDVRTLPIVGDLFASLVEAFKPSVVVEVGTAFGVSGMYFLAGLEANQAGHLYTFEPNAIWRSLAVRCLEQISERFTSVEGTFEKNVDAVLGQIGSIDLAFIDGIHDSEHVLSQLDLVVERCRKPAIVILDDVAFNDSMRECWRRVGRQERFLNSVTIGGRLGIVEYGGSEPPT